MLLANFLKNERKAHGQLAPLVTAAASLLPKLKTVADSELERSARQLREAVRNGESSSQSGWFLREKKKTSCITAAQSMAYACEAIKREMGFYPYPVQMLATLAVSSGRVIDMKTGEGKSIVAVMAGYLAALNGFPVHIATTNAYLAERDAAVANSILSRLGVSVGSVLDSTNTQANRDAYKRDVTFGPGYQFGFDFLMDQSELRSRNNDLIGKQIVNRLDGQLPYQLIQPTTPAFAIVDEADSVLIDEATTPMILSKTSVDVREEQVYIVAKKIADEFTSGQDFRIQNRRVELLENGKNKLLRAFEKTGGKKLERTWSIYIENALMAKYEYRKNEHYVAVEGTVRIVDTQTGRIFEDRSWQNGLHQAIEVKEGVPLTASRNVIARVTRQRFFQRYQNVSGMTGTLGNLGSELLNSYGAQSMLIPSHLRCQRLHMPARMFIDWESKINALGKEILSLHYQGRPVLVGTKSIEKSVLVCEALRRIGLEPTLLNGLQDRSEAELVALAGVEGAITVATNMAGRGTDIKLSDRARLNGGLHVIGTEPHESARIDQQLFGRAARQGDPGSSQLFASCDDSLFEFTNEFTASRLRAKANSSGEIRSSFDHLIRSSQSAVDRKNALLREKLTHHDRWLDSAKKGYESFS